MFLVYTSSRSLIIQFDRRLLIFHSHRKLLVIKATKLQEISTFHNSKNGLPRGPPLVYTKERSLDPNHTIFKNSAPKYTYSQNISQFCDLACSTFCMVLHGFLVDSLLSDIPWDTAYTFDDVNDIWCHWESLLKQAIDHHAPLKRVNLKSNHLPWINPAIQNQRRIRNLLYE